MSNHLYAALSIVSNLGKDENLSLDNVHELSKDNISILQGTFENINNIYGLLTKENKQSYFYSFDLSSGYKIIKDNKEISFSKLKEGDNISVSYNGNVILVYPPKLENVTKIEVVTKHGQ